MWGRWPVQGDKTSRPTTNTQFAPGSRKTGPACRARRQPKPRSVLRAFPASAGKTGQSAGFTCPPPYSQRCGAPNSRNFGTMPAVTGGRNEESNPALPTIGWNRAGCSSGANRAATSIDGSGPCLSRAARRRVATHHSSESMIWMSGMRGAQVCTAAVALHHFGETNRMARGSFGGCVHRGFNLRRLGNGD